MDQLTAKDMEVTSLKDLNLMSRKEEASLREEIENLKGKITDMN